MTRYTKIYPNIKMSTYSSIIHTSRAVRLPSITNAARRAGERRRDVHRRVLREEVPRTKQNRHGLRGHDRVVFRRWEVGDAECVPHDDVLVFDAGVCVGCDPCWQACEIVSSLNIDGRTTLWGLDLPCDGLPEFCGTCLPAGNFSSSAYLVTCRACLAKPARSQTRLFSLGINPGTSRETILYDTGFLE